MKYIKIVLNTLLFVIPSATFVIAMILLEKSKEYSEKADDIFGSSMDTGIVVLLLIPIIFIEIDFLHNVKCLVIGSKNRFNKIICAVNIAILSVISLLLISAFLPNSILPHINTNAIIEKALILFIFYVLFRIIVVAFLFYKKVLKKTKDDSAS